jgi:peptidoglycan hydrolase-like protein with peptidoglycan-binding domain
MADPCVLFDDVPEHESEHPTARKASLERRLAGGTFRRRAVSRLGHLLPRSSYPCAVPGINLNDYSKLPSGKGWGAACSGGHTTITLADGLRMTCRSEIAELSTLLWNRVLAQGYNLRAGVCGCYNCRYISGTTTWSNHAWALAFDINWDVNPYTTGTTHDIPGWVVSLANRYGFAWGGDYTGGRRDYMHFEFMGTPAQAVAATNLARAELAGDVPVPPPTPTDDSAVIRQRQFNLNDTGFPVVVDGVWGPASVQACKNFQRAAHLAVDGVYGDATAAALRKVPSWKYTAFGGQPVRTWQQQLVNHGWHLEVDGVWGAHSVSICQQFQRDKQLATQDGSPSPDTWTALHCTVN